MHHQKPVASTGHARLPPELEHELRNIREEFTVDTAKLKEIVQHFEKELAEGLEKPRQNIVGQADSSRDQLLVT